MRRFYILIICLFIVLVTGSCAFTDRLALSDTTGTVSPEHGVEPVRTEMKLYFRNNNYNSADPGSTPVIPVTRSVPRDELTARFTLNALISGPSPGEKSGFDAGPVINGTDLHIDDIYIKNGICVVHLSSSHPLPLYNYENQTDVQAEAVFAQSLLLSLAGLPRVEAVWLFHDGNPWQSSAVDWLCPLAPPGPGVNYTLYFCRESTSYFTGQGVGFLEPVQIRLFSSDDPRIEACPFKRVIDLLAQDYDPSHKAPLPQEVHVLSFNLSDHVLIIDLAGPFHVNPQQARAFAGALVYTFTGLPEIDAVMVTVEGQTWENGGIVWDHPLYRDDFKREMDSSVSRSGFTGY